MILFESVADVIDQSAERSLLSCAERMFQRLPIGECGPMTLRAVYCPDCGTHRTAITPVFPSWSASVAHIPCGCAKKKELTHGSV